MEHVCRSLELFVCVVPSHLVLCTSNSSCLWFPDFLYLSLLRSETALVWFGSLFYVLRSGRCLQTESQHDHSNHLLCFSPLMNHNPVWCFVQYKNIFFIYLIQFPKVLFWGFFFWVFLNGRSTSLVPITPSVAKSTSLWFICNLHSCL